MSSKYLCKAFVEGAIKGKGNNMRIRGNEIFSYAEVIGRREIDGAFSLSPREYNQTTRKHQCYLRRALEYANIKYTYKDEL